MSGIPQARKEPQRSRRRPRTPESTRRGMAGRWYGPKVVNGGGIEVRGGGPRRQKQLVAVLLVPVLAAGCTAQPKSPDVGQPRASASVATSGSTTGESGPGAVRVVTSVADLVGVWRPVQLDGQTVFEARDKSGDPLTLTVVTDQAAARWTATGDCAPMGGGLAVDPAGRFSAEIDTHLPAGGCQPDSESYEHASVIAEADQALIRPYGSTPLRQLVLLSGGSEIASYYEVSDQPGLL